MGGQGPACILVIQLRWTQGLCHTQGWAGTGCCCQTAPAAGSSPLSCGTRSCACSGSIPEQWAQLEGLQVLRLRHNRLTGTLPPGGLHGPPGQIIP